MSQPILKAAFFVLVAWFGVSASRCAQSNKGRPAQDVISFAKALTLDREQAARDLAEVAKAPHPFGSNRQKVVAEYLQNRAAALGFTVLASSFTADVPNPILLTTPDSPSPTTLRREGRNIYAKTKKAGSKECAILVASHYDSKEIDGISYLGANDSGSSSVLLLQILSAAVKYESQVGPLACEVIGVWFDGEEPVLPNWSDGELRHPAKIADHTYGSRYEASRLSPCGSELCLPEALGKTPVKALILLDMVGSPNLKLTREANSHADLVEAAEEVGKALTGTAPFTSFAKAIEDDHIPFKERGVKVLNLIDFENLGVWHQDGDAPAAVSLDSLEKVLRLAAALVLQQST